MTKRTVILFVCLVIFAALLVLNGTVFVAKDITVTDYVEQGELDKQKIAEYSGVSGKNIFTISESIVIENIENMMPDVKVVNVERKFPSQVKIVVLKRVAIIAVEIADGYAIIDRECQIINKVDNLDEYPTIVTLSGVSVETSVLGEALGVDATTFARINQIISTFEQLGESYRNENFGLAVDNILFNGDNVTIKMSEGVKLVFDASTECFNKLRALISYFNTHEDKRASGTLYCPGTTNAQNMYDILFLEDSAS